VGLLQGREGEEGEGGDGSLGGGGPLLSVCCPPRLRMLDPPLCAIFIAGKQKCLATRIKALQSLLLAVVTV